jgi:hypothetical protein
MGTTPNFAIPYPEPTDFVADGAVQMENLAERSDDALYAIGMGRNRLINGDMRVAQRGTSFVSGANNDNTYNLDRWVVLSDGNDIVDITQANVAPSGGLFSIGLDVETVNKKFGILQVIEQRNIVGMFNQPVTLSFSARTSGSSIANMKAVILAWTGTGDTVTRDVVSAWGADGVTPTFAANWTAENTPQNLAPSNSWERYEITANLDTASTNNVAVFIWCDDMTTTLGDFLYITDVQLEVGTLATPFERKLFSTVLAECQRYYESSYSIGVAEGTNTSDNVVWFAGVLSGNGSLLISINWNVPKRITDYSIAFYRTNGTAGSWEYDRSGSSGGTAGTVGDLRGSTRFRLVAGTGTSTGFIAVHSYGHWAVRAEL